MFLTRLGLCTRDLAAPSFANASARSLYTSLLCAYKCIMCVCAILALFSSYMSCHTSWCRTGCLPCAIHPRRLYALSREKSPRTIWNHCTYTALDWLTPVTLPPLLLIPLPDCSSGHQPPAHAHCYTPRAGSTLRTPPVLCFLIHLSKCVPWHLPRNWVPAPGSPAPVRMLVPAPCHIHHPQTRVCTPVTILLYYLHPRHIILLVYNRCLQGSLAHVPILIHMHTRQRPGVIGWFCVA